MQLGDRLVGEYGVILFDSKMKERFKEQNIKSILD